MRKNLLKTLTMAFAISLFAPAFGEQTPIESLHSYKLKNGLELFVAENHTVPLVYIEIAVRCGGVSQTEETAGLFHLYEHLMFDGNSKFKTEQDIQNQFTNLGVTTYNGTTTEDYVNYFFTIPADKLKEGLEFWNYAIRTPNIDKKILEKEKKVVISEINGAKNEISYTLTNILAKEFYGDRPWVKQVSGTEQSVTNATVKQIKNIQKKYYVPNNAALFVGGDVNPDEVHELTKAIFGSWKKADDPWKDDKHQFEKKTLNEIKKYVVSYDQLSPQVAYTSVFFRGPDAEYDRNDTYLVDTLLLATRNPGSYFKTSLVNNQNLGIMDSDYVSMSYRTSRRMGTIDFTAMMMYPTQYMPLRAQIFAEEIIDSVKGTLSPQSPLTQNTINSIHRMIYNENLYERETFSSLLATTRFWWACADADYYYSYTENINKTDASSVADFVSRYLENTNPLIVVILNPEIIKQCKAEFLEAGYEVIE